MRKLSYLLLFFLLTTVGCMELPGNFARNASVGGLPPEIDPKLKTTDQGKQNNVKREQESDAKSLASDYRQASSNLELPSNKTVTNNLRRPRQIQPEDVNSNNAHEMAAALTAEIDFDANQCSVHGELGCPHCEMK